MDSTTVAAEYAENANDLVFITVDYGQKHVREIRAAEEIAAHYGAGHVIVDLGGLGRELTGSALTDRDVDVPEGHYAEQTMRSTVVPNHNAVLASVAVAIAMSRRADVLALGMHAGDHFIHPDCRPQFVNALREVVRVGNEGFGPPALESPFLTWTKSQIAARAAQLAVPLHLTWSSWSPIRRRRRHSSSRPGPAN